jgi:NDP-sugar pyrophosphorylase family protein
MNKWACGVILAAGHGTRMGTLSAYSPKPLLPNEDNCLLRHQINFLKDFVECLYVTVGYKSEQVLLFLRHFPKVKALDTAGMSNSSFLGLSELYQFRSEQIVILTCDNPMKMDLNSLYIETLKRKENSFLVSVNQKVLKNELRLDQRRARQNKGS